MVEQMENREDQFEKELREQLRPRSAPAGFAERVLSRMPTRVPERRRLWPLWQPDWRWAAIAAVIVVTILGGVEHDRQQRIAGERARQQVLLALRITGTTLRQVQEKVHLQANNDNNGDGARE